MCLLPCRLQHSFKFSMATDTSPRKLERMLDTTGQQQQTVSVCVPQFVLVCLFRGPVASNIRSSFRWRRARRHENLNKCWTQPCVCLCLSSLFCFAGRSRKTFVQVFNGDLPVDIENLNECWTQRCLSWCLLFCGPVASNIRSSVR